MDAATLLKAAAHVYATCRTYADEGTSITTFTDSGQQAVVSFSTLFERPGRLRFEYRANTMGLMQDHLVLCADNGPCNLWWSVHGNREEVPLQDALASATGVSGGVAHIIPRLLLPGIIDGPSLLELEAPRLAGDAMDDGVECTVVEGVLPRRGPMVLWLDRSSFLLRKVVQPPVPIHAGGEMDEEIRTAMREHVVQAAATLGMTAAQANEQADQFLRELASSDPAEGIVTTQTTLYRPSIGGTHGADAFQYAPPR